MSHRLRPVALAALAVAVFLAASCSPPPTGEEPTLTMDIAAEDLVRLALALGRHDADYVDAYLGPEEWRQEAVAEGLTLDAIAGRARALAEGLAALPELAGQDSMDALRRRHLAATIGSLEARVAILQGQAMSFDDESRALYDAVAPHLSAEHFEEILGRLDAELPGSGPVVDRWDAFRSAFVIPGDRLDAVFGAAIEACRERTARHLDLPEGESFRVEYVTDKSWSGYNWYQGGYESLIQVNTDLPIHIDRAIDLACHEGYPGHHVYNLVVERDLVRGRGWVEFSIYPLFSPRSLIAEGSANYGIEVAFPGDERMAFERDVLFPLAGLDPARAEEYARARRLVEGLGYAGNEAARRYLDGEIDGEAAVQWLMRYALMPRQRAEQRLRFIQQYRSYVINYNLGQDLVRRHVEALGGTADRPEERWRIFGELLAKPLLPSELAGATR